MSKLEWILRVTGVVGVIGLVVLQAMRWRDIRRIRRGRVDGLWTLEKKDAARRES